MNEITNSKVVLVVDDDHSVLTSMALLLKQNGYSSLVASSPAEALALLKEKPVDLVLQDMNYSRKTTGEEGMELLKDIQNHDSNIPVLLMTAWGSISLAVAGIRLGAIDFITKPWDNQRLIQTINTSLSLSAELEDEVLSRSELNEQYNFDGIIGNDPAMLKVLTTVARISKTDASVMILGESGTGKEVIADAIHQNSPRKDGPLVKVNLGGINTSLFESEMFGHVKGAFTDAKTDRQGRFAMADNGTIFLDEIGDLDKASQVKLLRVLQDQTYQAVGSSVNSRSNVRVVSATNKDLELMVNEHEFREDLLYRLNLITIHLPPLRERRGDIKLLAESHLTQIEKMYGINGLTIESSAIKWLEGQDWPGNVRQLKQTIERAVLMSGKDRLTLSELDQNSNNSQENKTPSNVDNISNLTLDEVEKLMIEKSLEIHNNHITKVANALGLSRAALYRRLDKYGIKV